MYLELRPWIRSHPNMNIYAEATEPGCPNCGSFNIIDGGHYVTPANRYTAYRCNNCGAPFRGRTSDLTKNEKKVLKISTAR